MPIGRTITAWMFSHLLWDTAGSTRRGFLGALWALRKLLVALAAAAVLTWREWVEHHPPEIALIAVIHFIFVFALIAALVYCAQRLGKKAVKHP
jgi:hypothetical protein